MEEKIEVGYRWIGSVLGKDVHHKFLLYTDKQGEDYTISGWTGDPEPGMPDGKISVLANLAYDANNPDHPLHPNAKGDAQYRELIATGPDLSPVWKQIAEDALKKDRKYPYDAQLQNSNTLADSLLRDAGLPEPRRDNFNGHWAPGSGRQLDESLKAEPLRFGNSGRTISLNEGGADRARDAQLRADPLFKQALDGLDRLGPGFGMYADEVGRENLAAALAAKARCQTPPLPEIHDVLCGNNGEKIFAVWKNPGNEQHMLRAHVDVEEAVRRPAEQSLQALATDADLQERMRQDQVELGRGAVRMG